METRFFCKTKRLRKNRKPPSDAWRNCKPAHPRAPGRTLIIMKLHATTIVDDFPKKIPKLPKGKMFDITPMDIITAIDTWISGLK